MTSLAVNSTSAILSRISLSSRLRLDAIFDSRAPLEVDVGCGKGRFLAGRAASHPECNFLGMDKKLSRLRKVDRKLTHGGLTNVRLLHVEAAYAIEYLLPPASVSVYYIFFPDPWPKRKHRRRRLFSPEFMDSLHASLCDRGCCHVATDHLDYLAGIRGILLADGRFEEIEAFVPPEEEQTDFEIAFTRRNTAIGRCSFRKVSL